MRSIKYFWPAGTACLLVFSLLTCGDKGTDPEPNNHPQITNLSIVNESGVTLSPSQLSTIRTETRLTFAVTAMDPDAGDSLRYSWSCNIGTMTGEESASVSWTAPGSDATGRVIITVSDGQLQAKDTLAITVFKNPYLSNGSVTPGGGNATETYIYSITFADPLGNAPNSAKLVIDGTEHDLTKVAGTYDAGATYEYQTGLVEGYHTYRFRFMDNQNMALFFPSGGYETSPIVTADTTIVYQSSTVPVDEQDSLSLSTINGSVYTYDYTGQPPNIDVNDIILSVDTGGYLRRVTASTVTGNQIVLSTEQASLADAFDRIIFDTTVTINFDASSSMKTATGQQPYLASGVQVHAGQITLDNRTLFSGDVGGTPVDITIESGSFDFQPDLDVGCDIGVFSAEVHAIAIGTAYLDIVTSVEADAGFSKSGEVLLAYLPIPLEWASIPAQIDFSLYAGYEVEMAVEGQALFNMSGQATAEVGFEYEDGDFSEVWNPGGSWVSSAPTWNAQGNAQARVYLRPEISIKVLHVAGPYIDALPYLSLNGAVTANPYCWEWGVYAGLEANVGLELDIFVSSYSYGIPLFGLETQLAGDEFCNTEPVVTITSPTENSFGAGVPIEFAGTAQDIEDGMLSGTSLVWTSDKDGQIGTGESLNKNDLSVNTHTIVLTATDSKGAVDTDTVLITIGPLNSPPVATISSPTDGDEFAQGVSLQFIGTAFDEEDGVIDAEHLVWTSDKDGLIGLGESFLRDNLSLNSHTITLTATDSDGGVGTIRVNINVNNSGESGSEIEPNDDRSQATPILNEETFGASISPVGDQDWFSFSSSSATNVDFEIDPNGDYISVSFYDTEGNYLHNHTVGPDVWTIPLSNLPKGTKFINIREHANSNIVESYQITYSSTTIASGIDTFEPDNDSSSTNQISVDETQEHAISPLGDEDWILHSGTPLTYGSYDIDPLGSYLVIDRYIIWPAASLFHVKSDTIGRELKTIEFTNLGGGEFYLRIREVTHNDVVGSYTVKYSETPITGTLDSYEPDNDSSSANPISAGEIQEHTIFPYGDLDWLSYTISTNSNIVFDVDAHGMGLFLIFYDSEGNAIRDWTGCSTPTSIPLTNVRSGTNYVRIHGSNPIAESYPYHITYNATANAAGSNAQ